MCSSSKCLATTTAALLGTLQYNQSIWKCDCETNESRGVNPGGWRVATPRFCTRGFVDGSRNIIISYHVQEVCSKVVDFEEKWNNLPIGSCKWPILPWK